MPIPELVARLTERVRAFFAGDAAAVLADEAMAEAERLHSDPPRDEEEAWLAARALAWLYWCRYQALPAGDSDVDLARAMSLFEIVASVDRSQVPETVLALLDHEFRHPQVQATHANALLRRYLKKGDVVALDDAIMLLSNAIVEIPGDHPDRHESFSNFASALYLRYTRAGDTEDIDNAITAGRAALEAAPVDHYNRPAYLSNLGSVLIARFTFRSDVADLDEAVAAGGEAVEAAPPGSPQRPLFQMRLGNAHKVRFKVAGVESDLDAAFANLLEAAAATPVGHPQRAETAASLASVLTTRFERHGDGADLDQAITLFREAAEAFPDGDPHSASNLSELGSALWQRFNREHDRDDLEEAIEAGRRSLAATPEDHPSYAVRLSTLGNALLTRSLQPGATDQLDEAVLVGGRAASIPTAPASIRIRAAQTAAATAVESADKAGTASGYRTALTLLETAIGLLPVLAWRGLEREHQQRELEDSAAALGRNAAACAIAIGDETLAVRLLEQSRGLLWRQLLDLRTDVTDLRAAHPALAAEIEECRAVLDRPEAANPELDGRPSEERHRSQRADAARRFDALLGEVRSLDPTDDFPNPRDFLRPPPVERLLPPEGAGPVVIVNISGWRCDALIVEATGVDSVRLPITADEVFAQVNSYLTALHQQGDLDSLEGRIKPVLAWMWDKIAAPVLERIGADAVPAGEPPRIWWCPTGPLTLLPIHAAGHHADRDGRAVLDRVVSSYTPTLRALADARARPAPEGESKMLVVAMSETPEVKDGELPGALSELELLKLRMEDADLTTLVDGEASRESIVTGLSDHEWAHIACHGIQDLERPSRGGLMPYDWKAGGLVTIADLTEPGTGGGEFAFLSACQTATGGVTNLDEAVNVTAAMQHSGWRHVIGTLWTVDDEASTVTAGLVYGRIAGEGRLDPTESARALHEAIRALRDQSPEHTALWARFIHTGP